MKNKKILVSMVAVPMLLLSVNSYASDDVDCESIDREEIRVIMDKERNGESLTDDEQELLDSSMECRPERNGEGGKMMKGENEDKPELTDEQKEEMAEMKAIMEKVKNGEDLTDDEQEKYDDFIENREEKKDNVKAQKVKRVVKNLSTKTKTSIGSAMIKVNKAYSKLSDEQKIERYNTLIEKLDTKLEDVLNNDDFSDAKKELFENILNELMNQLDDKISELEG